MYRSNVVRVNFVTANVVRTIFVRAKVVRINVAINIYSKFIVNVRANVVRANVVSANIV
jgi:hypothetical protein